MCKSIQRRDLALGDQSDFGLGMKRYFLASMWIAAALAARLARRILGLPVPDLIISGEEFGQVAAWHDVQSVDQLAGLDAAFAESVFYHIDFRALAFQLGEIAGDLRRLRLLLLPKAAAEMNAPMQEIVDGLVKESKARYVSPYSMGRVYGSIKDKKQTFAWLDKAYEEHHPDMIELTTEPCFDSVRSDPRFKQLLSRVGFLGTN